MQKILNLDSFKEYLSSINNILIVCGKEFYKTNLCNELNNILNNKNYIYFDNFKPNPTYESVVDGIKVFKDNKLENIIVIGGGSAIDVAKCIKLFSNMDDSKNYLEQEIKENNVNLLAVPTTAGTGSEATKFAVIYYNNKKQSITHESCIPSLVLFLPELLETLPLYQKKSTVLDALSHSVESIWSINSNEESTNYSVESIKLILNNFKDYLNNNKETYNEMLKASNLAGKAINITKTTAGHALCYKLTSLYGISHGHSAMLVNSILYPYMLENMDKCIDKRGLNYLKERFNLINELFKDQYYFKNLLKELDLYNVNVNYDDINELVSSVNIERLSNNPIKLDNEDIKKIYLSLFKEIGENKCK